MGTVQPGRPWGEPTIEPLGDGALLVRFGDEIDPTANDRVLALADALERAPLRGQRDLVPAYASLAVLCDPVALGDDGLEGLIAGIRRTLARIGDAPPRDGRVVELEVCYDRALAPDLDVVAKHAGVSCDEVATLHCAPLYRVHMIGFTPGFPYLAGLDPRLEMPRRAAPVEAVEAGSVGIGGAQTGVYPATTPGGWWIIGRTRSRLFRHDATPPSMLAPGDTVRFRPISLDRFNALDRSGAMNQSEPGDRRGAGLA